MRNYLWMLPLTLTVGCASKAQTDPPVVYQQVPFQSPEVCLRGPVEVPAPIVSETRPDQTKDPVGFWKSLASDIKQTAIERSGALEIANERLTSCRASLPQGASVVLEVEPK